MVETTQSATPPASADSSASAAKPSVNYTAEFAELKQKTGIQLDDEEQKKYIAVSEAAMQKHNIGRFSSVGAVAQNAGFDLMAFIQAIAGLFSGDTGPISNIFSNFGAAFTGTAQKGDLNQVQLAAAETSAKLMDSHDAKLAAAAASLTGTQLSADNNQYAQLDNNFINQMAKIANLSIPVDTNTSLNKVTAQTGLPNASTQALTQRG
jgi:hypothetical protein